MGRNQERAGDFGKALRAWLFLITVAGLYCLTALFNPSLVSQALGSFGSLLIRIIPALAFVFCLIFLTTLFLDRRWLVRNLGNASGIRGWALAVICGVFSLGSLYAWYPLLGELKDRGMSCALLATFLYARALKLPLLPLMVHYFGAPFTVALSVCIIAFSVLSGLLMKRIIGIEKDYRY